MIKVVLGIIAGAMAGYSYMAYFRDIFRGKTKPHAFSWLVWGTMTAIGFAAQLSKGGGAGAWVTGFTAAACLSIFVLALFRGEKNITRSDWICLTSAGFAIVPWILTDDPLLSVILITVIDLLGNIPTIRKSYFKPFEETLITFELSAIKFVLAILALNSLSVTTVLYPLSLVFVNIGFVIMMRIRRSQLSPQPEPVLID